MGCASWDHNVPGSSGYRESSANLLLCRWNISEVRAGAVMDSHPATASGEHGSPEDSRS